MPYVNLKITRDGATAEQKALIVAEFTETLQRVLGKRPEHTHIIIDEVEPGNWGFSGMLTTEYRQEAKGADIDSPSHRSVHGDEGIRSRLPR
jgi:4-oxalocrotonate tautomerase